MKTADLLAKWASETPDAVAVVSNGKSLTFAELNTLVMQLATKISTLGPSQNDLVAVRLSRALDYPVTLALMVLGIPSMSDVKGSNLAPGDYGVTHLVSSERDGAFPAENNIVIDQLWWTAAESSTVEQVSVTIDATKPIRFPLTSGSTGEPKACAFTLEEVEARLIRIGDGVAPLERAWPMIGLAGIISFVVTYRNLFFGSTAYLLDQSHEKTLDLLVTNQIQEIIGSPSQLSWLSDSLGRNAVRLWSLKKLTCTGGALSPGLLETLRQQFSCEIESVFGSTESARVAYSSLNEGEDFQELTLIPDTKAEIVDDNEAAVAQGKVGNLRVKNAYLATSYILKDASEEPVQKDGWFYPGDRASLNEAGRLTIHHRDSDVTTVGGARVNLAVVERTLIETGMVQECKCFVYEIPGTSKQVLAIALQGKHLPSDEKVSEIVWGVLPEQVSLVIHPMSQIPKSSTGKVGSLELAEIEKDLTAKLG